MTRIVFVFFSEFLSQLRFGDAYAIERLCTASLTNHLDVFQTLTVGRIEVRGALILWVSAWRAQKTSFAESVLIENLSLANMNPIEIKQAIVDILKDIAPDEPLSELRDDQSFRDQMELDSMDFLDIVMELRKRYRVQVPEEDYPSLASMASTVEYLEPKMREI